MSSYFTCMGAESIAVVKLLCMCCAVDREGLGAPETWQEWEFKAILKKWEKVHNVQHMHSAAEHEDYLLLVGPKHLDVVSFTSG